MIITHARSPISEHDAASARKALVQLGADQSTVLKLHAAGSDTAVKLPQIVVSLLRELLEAIAHGKAVAVIPVEQELSTFELAELLSVSRPHAITLLERGLIPFQFIGSHRRVRLEDALKYKDAQYKRSLEAMAALQAQNEALGLQ
jgi:excisionase family DNA binding protein